MAITRAQQAKQMLQNGGRIRFERGGGFDAAQDDFSPSGPPGDEGDKREQRAVATTQGLSPTSVSDLGIDRSKVGQFSQFGFNTMAQNLPGPSPVDRAKDFFLNNTILGLGLRGLSKFGTKFGPTTTANITDRFGYPTDVQGFGRPSSIGPTGPTRGDEGGKDIPIWMQLGYNSEAEYLAAMAGGASPSEPAATEDPPVDLNRVAYRLMADGGAVMDDEPRQAYGLGSIVKKATRAIKKVAKSDIGKLALIAGLSFGIPGTNIGGLFGRASFMTPGGAGVKGLFGTKGIGQAFQLAKLKAGNVLLGPADPVGTGRMGTGLLSKIPGGKVGAGILAASALPFFMGDDEDDKEAELSPYLTAGLDIDAIRADPRAAQGRAFRLMAEGGSTEEKEPVAKKVMPLIDMDGKEKDYRETGGFVDIGRMEKADDVPARLSKNEFVFTADAVRNAGDGSVDKGAEVMYNMMKNLEAGGEVSEESQGLEGARKMFKTSQRLEEVL